MHIYIIFNQILMINYIIRIDIPRQNELASRPEIKQRICGLMYWIFLIILSELSYAEMVSPVSRPPGKSLHS